MKFLIAGLVGISVNLGIFHMLYVFGVPYLAGSIVAFLVAVFVGFVLQKYWTFEERTIERARTQLVFYVTLALVNLAVNTLIVYILVGKIGMFYLLAQTVGAAVVAIDSFFAYRSFIFKSQQKSSSGSA